MAEENLKKRTVKGVGWSAADAFLGQGVTFLVGIVLARILTPSEYGLIGIVLIFTTVLSGVVDSGFSTSLIRKNDVTDDDYNTMFITNLAMSLLVYAVLFFSAPLISLFFKRPELVNLTRVTGLILIFQALSITQVTILTKRIDFKTKTKASVVSAVTSGIIGVTMAYAGFGVWSLVGQQLSNKLIYSICLWILNKWWPNLRFNISSFRYMWGFGWKMMLAGLLNNIWAQLYQVVVGRFYSPATLGQYTRSKEYASLFSSNFTNIVQRVTYPSLAEIQDDKDRMVAAYRKIIKTCMFITSVLMISLGAVAEPFIYCLIGPQWNEAANFLPLICVSLSLYPLHAINLNMLQIMGRSDIILILEIIKKILAVVPLLLGIFVSIYWMLIGSIIFGVLCIFLNTYYSGKKLNYTSWMQIKDIAPSYFVAFIIALSVYFMKFLPLSNFIILPLQIGIGAIVGYVVCKIMNLEEFNELIRVAKDGLNTIKNLKHHNSLW